MQTKLGSFIESLLNTASGFLLSYLSWVFVLPLLFGIKTSPTTGIGVTAFYTVLSIGRCYVWRRIFNKGEK